MLLRLTAVGIIGLIVYLSALERVRDLAVLKAAGASTVRCSWDWSSRRWF